MKYESDHEGFYIFFDESPKKYWVDHLTYDKFDHIQPAVTHLLQDIVSHVCDIELYNESLDSLAELHFDDEDEKTKLKNELEKQVAKMANESLFHNMICQNILTRMTPEIKKLLRETFVPLLGHKETETGMVQRLTAQELNTLFSGPNIDKYEFFIAACIAWNFKSFFFGDFKRSYKDLLPKANLLKTMLNLQEKI
jgi:hypothetical protein